MKYEKLMAQYGYTAETVSRSVQRKIADYSSLEEGLQISRKQLKDDPENTKLAGQIETIEKGLIALDAEIAKDIERLNKNGYGKGGAYDALKKNLKGKTKTKEPKAPASEPAPAQEPAPAPTPANASSEPPKQTAPAPNPPQPNKQPGSPKTPPVPTPPKPPVKKDAKKNNNGIMVALGILGIAAAAFFGFRAWKNKN